jgi:hypothetical protein
MKPKKRRGTICLFLVVLTLSTTLSPIGSTVNAQEAVFVATGPRKSDRSWTTKVEALARILMDADIDVIYTTARSSGVQTAETIAKFLNIKFNKISRNAAAIDDWTRRLPTEHAEQRVLILTVGPGPMPGEGQHILKGLGVPDKDIWARRSDHLMVIIPNESKEPLIIKMRW